MSKSGENKKRKAVQPVEEAATSTKLQAKLQRKPSKWKKFVGDENDY